MGGTWCERLQECNEILRKEKTAEQLDSVNARYVVRFDMKEVENSLRKDVVGKARNPRNQGIVDLEKMVKISSKLPYTYFLQKLDAFEADVPFFPLRVSSYSHMVDIPLDPFLFEMISSSGAEVYLLQKHQIHYFLKVLFALLPGILILWFIREAMMLLRVTTKHLFYKKWCASVWPSWNRQNTVCSDTCKGKWDVFCICFW